MTTSADHEQSRSTEPGPPGEAGAPIGSTDPGGPAAFGRRHALGLFAGAGAGVALALTACSSSSSSSSDRSPRTGSASGGDMTAGGEHVGEHGAEAEVVERTTGSGPVDVELNLWAEPTAAELFPGVTSDVYSFGAELVTGDPATIAAGTSYLGPTIHLRTGQRVKINFENRLPEESIVHWHGLVVPQDQDGQPSDAVGPGETYHYDFTVENRPGTYWYHPHPHGRTGEQVYRGLAGLLIVHGDDEPELPTGDNDLGLVLQDRTVSPDGTLTYVSSMHDRMAGFVGTTLITNGVADYVTEIDRRPYRLRLLNGANSRTQRLAWSTGEPLIVIAVDGHLLPQPVELDALVITPAQRSDLWIDFSRYRPGDRVQLLTTDTFVEGAMMGGGMGMGEGGMSEGMGGGMMGESGGGAAADSAALVAATFVVADSDPIPGSLPDTLGADPDFSPDDAVNTDNPKQFVLSTRRGAHWINDSQWEGRVASDTETVRAGTVEVWEFVNLSPMVHPMHLHGRSFLVVDRSWEDDSLAAEWDALADGVIDSAPRDTVLVWPGQRVRIAVPFAEHTGYFVYHCHILEHEDAGMMRNFHVV